MARSSTMAPSSFAWRLSDCVAVCCSVLQRVAAYGSVWQCVAVARPSTMAPFSFASHPSECGAACRVCCGVLQCVAVCCSVLRCVAVCCGV